MTNSVPVSVDYTNRDYYSLKNILTSRIQNKFQGTGKQWSGTDPADFGVALVESFAYMGDLFNYYIDRLANENYITTATQRQSIINLANNYGYTVSGYRAASTTFRVTNGLSAIAATVTNAVSSAGYITYTAANTFTVGQVVTVTNLVATAFNVTDAVVTSANATTFSVVGTASGTYSSTGTATVSNLVSLPKGSQFALTVPYAGNNHLLYFTTIADSSITAKGTNAIAAVNGRYAASLVGNDSTYGEMVVSNAGIAGQPNQRYKLTSNQVVDGSIVVFIQRGSVYEQWSQVGNLVDYGPADAVFSVELDAQNNVYLNFGDGISGAIPNANATIWANYLISDGSLGNIAQNAGSPGVYLAYVPGISSTSVLGSLSANLTIVNSTQAVGGYDPESNDSIRANAPLALRALNRAVTLRDFSDLALAVGNVGKAKAVATSPASVTLYVSLQQNDAAGNATPGQVSGVVTQDWYDLQTAVASYLSDKIQIGTTLTIAPPVFVPAKVVIKFTKLPQYSSSEVTQNIKLALLNGFGYNFVNFKDVITPEEIEQVLNKVTGVNTVKVISHYRGSTVARTTLIGAANEIFYYIEANSTIQEYSSVANLTSLTFSAGTLSATFSPTFYNYNLTLPNGTTSITATPTLSTASSITVNGNVTASGVASTAISTPVGTTTFAVTAIAEDGFTNVTYTINAVRTA